MCVDASGKHVVLDSIMDQYAADIRHDALPDLEWHAIDNVSTFLRAPSEVMESPAADHKSTLDLVPMSVSLLLKHYNDNEQQLQEIDGKLTAIGMKAKLKKYKSKLVQEPTIIATYLNPQIPKLTDPAELKLVVDLVRNSLQRRYSTEVSSRQSIE
jgi:hypothetical protein